MSISVNDIFINKLIELGKKHYPNEFGGFLVGYYSDDSKQLNITDTILPTKYKATKHQFERDTIGITESLKNYYEQIPKTYYVGEWHTHPDNLPIPSIADIKAIKEILNHKKTSIQNPVLLIIAYSEHSAEFGFYVPYENKLYKYENK